MHSTFSTSIQAFKLIGLFSLFMAIMPSCKQQAIAIDGTLTAAQPFSMDIEGPMLDEQSSDNPFLDYRLIVNFSNGVQTFHVPGYFAADGNAGESSATAGNIWRVHFTPPTPGKWYFMIDFKKGKDLAIDGNLGIGEALKMDGKRGNIDIKPLDTNAPGFYRKGKLEYDESHFLKHVESDQHFIKGGAGSPENLLAYIDFDGTKRMNIGEQREGEASTTESLHRYEKHIKDWKVGDASWKNGKGKGIIGGLNYLESKGVNSCYFLSMNINGDGKDVWPYTDYNERFRFDCSKLDQWNIVFDHMDRKGILMHILLQETENETLLDEGYTGRERKMYLREMIARFSHHLGVVWDMGEENGPVEWSPKGQSREQAKTMLDYISEVDPYKNLRVIHSHADRKTRREMFSAMLGHPSMNGMSMQINPRQEAHEESKYWLNQSRNTIRNWVISVDEIGHYTRGADPDDRPNNNQDSIRKEVLWGNLMAGGAGVEWYFGYTNHNNDLQCEDWRSREQLWDYTHYATAFFYEQLDFWKMQNRDELILSENAWCLAEDDQCYVVYTWHGESVDLDLSKTTKTYQIRQYNPKTGEWADDLENIKGGKILRIGANQSDGNDWVYLLKAQTE